MLSNFEEALGFKLEASNFLYVLCDYETLLRKDISLKSFVNLCKEKDVKLLQYRDLISSIQIQQENLIFLKKSLAIPIIINDKIELIDYCDGLHLEQRKLSLIHKDKKLAIKLIRKKIRKKILVLSTFLEVEILESNELEIDMIEIENYKKTKTKDINSLFTEKIGYLSKISTHPVCIIGEVKIIDKIKSITFNIVESSLYITKRNTYGKN